MKLGPHIAFTLLVTALAGPVQAGLYKCARNDGSVTYQEEACPPGTELRDFEKDPASVSVVPFRIPPGTTETRSGPREKPPKAASERKSIFKAFRRGEQADAKAGGAGLGLALAHSWAEVLGARLTYQPADGGVGACFRLELPVK